MFVANIFSWQTMKKCIKINKCIFFFLLDLVKNQSLTLQIVSQDENDVFSVYLHNKDVDSESSLNHLLIKDGYATVVPGSQLDIDPDLQSEPPEELGS